MRKPLFCFTVTLHCITERPGTLPRTNQAMLLDRHGCDPFISTLELIIFVSPNSSQTILMNPASLTSSQVWEASSSNLGKESITFWIVSSNIIWLGGSNETLWIPLLTTSKINKKFCFSSRHWIYIYTPLTKKLAAPGECHFKRYFTSRITKSLFYPCNF